MKVAVIGCGAIGGLFLAYLSSHGQEVIGVVRDYQKEPLQKGGLFIEGIRGQNNYKVNVDTRLKEKIDLTIFATKMGDLEKALSDNIECLKDSVVLSTQNGIRADYILANHFPRSRIATG
ncbi:MAG: ketopantoate reductase family protein, partial [Candidatus Omnitrophota bacterium]